MSVENDEKSTPSASEPPSEEPDTGTVSDRLAIEELPGASSESCGRCGSPLVLVPRTGPFGFGVVRCDKCGRRHWSPLSRGARASYWVVIALTVVGFVLFIGSTSAALPAFPALIAAVLLAVDASMRKRHVLATVIGVGATAVTVTATLIALLIAGLVNGYAFEVVDRSAREVTVFDGVDFERGSRICRGGADYQSCAYMHAAMYNSLCTGSSWNSLTDAARRTCDDLSGFVDRVLERSANCGYGCTTQADGSGRWGWAYLRPVVRTATVTIDRVTHQEVCWFELGPLTLGSCS